jgi:hypothetical protein
MAPDSSDIVMQYNLGYFFENGINVGAAYGAIPSRTKKNYDTGPQGELGYLFSFGVNVTGIFGYGIEDKKVFYGNSLGYVFKNGFNIRTFLLIGNFSPAIGGQVGYIFSFK